MPDFTIRPAVEADIPQLADVHYRAYFTRFFDAAARGITGELYGAPLAAEHPCLVAGQDANYFRAYWDKFSLKLWDGTENENICLVAASGNRVLAFIKGARGIAGPENYDLIENPPAGDVAELGSIYVDPTLKLRKMGGELVASYARIFQESGYDQMVTAAYHRNDSPAFFGKLGATVIGACPIPNNYIDYGAPEQPMKVEVIKGILMHWDANAFETLCRTNSAPMTQDVSLLPPRKDFYSARTAQVNASL